MSRVFFNFFKGLGARQGYAALCGSLHSGPQPLGVIKSAVAGGQGLGVGGIEDCRLMIANFGSAAFEFPIPIFQFRIPILDFRFSIPNFGFGSHDRHHVGVELRALVLRFSLFGFRYSTLDLRF